MSKWNLIFIDDKADLKPKLVRKRKRSICTKKWDSPSRKYKKYEGNVSNIYVPKILKQTFFDINLR
jgi:hypothetical protein